jgi:hypothetical protein
MPGPRIPRALRTNFFPLASKRYDGQICVRGNVTAAAHTYTVLSELISILAVGKQGGLIIVGKFRSRVDPSDVRSFAVITP